MNREFWARPPSSPALNFDLTNILTHAYDPDPLYSIRALLSPSQQVGLNGLSYGITSVRPPFTSWTNSWGISVFVGGTSGQAHVIELLDGWNNLGIGPYPELGASGGFAHAAKEIIDLISVHDFVHAENVYLVGHSYGGAVVQAMAAILAGAFVQVDGLWSFGAPRPGTPALQRRVDAMRHYRFFNDDDPVRWIPPHTDETILMDVLSRTSLAIGMNAQVQTTTGIQIDRSGDITPATGEPTVLHRVGLSIVNWITDTNGFRSVNHSAAEYRRRFQLALPIKPDGPAIPRSQPEEPQGTMRPREVEDQVAAAMPTIEAAIANPSSPMNAEINQWPTGQPATRYKRRKYGHVWVVKYGDLVVDVGPGKRRAGQLARARNRVARTMAV